MLVTMKSMLRNANDEKYAVMAINCINMEQAKAIILAAEQECSPVIINISPRQMKAHCEPELLVKIVKHLADKVPVPVALNLDHGIEYEDCIRVMEAGFSSVMIDASAFEYEENIRRTKLITRLAHDRGLSVEGELGHVGIAFKGDSEKLDLYTNIEQAKDFVERTCVDCLAVAIGTAHGDYPKNMIPELDFERLAELKKSLKMPLVLHGGSGAGEANIRKAVALGINKINVCTDLFKIGTQAIANAIQENPQIDYMDVQIEGQKAMQRFIQNYMRLIGSDGRYNFAASTKTAEVAE